MRHSTTQGGAGGVTTLTTSGTAGAIRTARCDDVDLERDRALVERAQLGDQAAFDALYQRYYRRLLRFCLQRLHDPHEAEDVTQEAFARAWRALPAFGGERRFYPWLSVIAAHLCTDVLRRRNRALPVAELQEGTDLPSAEEDAESRILAAVDADLVTQAFQRLSDRHRRVLELREASGLSYQQIADQEGVGITTVETLLWRARQALKREFSALADSRLAGILGGLLGLAALRRWLRGLARLAHQASQQPALQTAAALTTAAALSAGAVLGSGVLAQGPSSPAHPASLGTSTGTLGRSSLVGHQTRAPLASTTAGSTHSSLRTGTGTGRSTLADEHAPTVAQTGSPSAQPTAQDASVGQGLATTAEGLTTTVGGVVQTLEHTTTDLLGTLGGTQSLGGAVSATASGLGTTVAGLGETVTGLGSTVGGLGSTVGSVTGALGSTVGSLGSALSPVTQSLPAPLSSALGSTTTTLGSTVQTVGSAAGDLLGTTGSAVQDLGSGLSAVGESLTGSSADGTPTATTTISGSSATGSTSSTASNTSLGSSLGAVVESLTCSTQSLAGSLIGGSGSGCGS